MAKYLSKFISAGILAFLAVLSASGVAYAQNDAGGSGGKQQESVKAPAPQSPDKKAGDSGIVLKPPTASEATIVSEQDENGTNPPHNVEGKADTGADLAYGAFQRGFYLTAFELALPRAQLGDPAAQTLIAEMYDKGLGVARDPKESTAWYGIAAKNGNVEAQFAYAVKLLEGKYVKPDVEEARRLMKIAADHGHASAAFNYGQMILELRPTSAGFREAVSYFEKAAEAGASDAYYMLSQIYQSGKLTGAPDYTTAQKWMIKAAQAGIDTAQVELGIWLANGKAGVKNEKLAYQWIRRAAVSGNVIGQNRLAKMLVRGIGTEADPVEGIKWHIIARRAGLNDRWLDDYMASLERSDLSKALEAANRWPSG